MTYSFTGLPLDGRLRPAMPPAMSQEVTMRRTKLQGKNRGRFAVLLMAVVLLALPFGFGPRAAHGQIVNASLAGSVTDPEGLVTPDAQITVTDVETRLSTKTTSDSTGYYIFPSLRPARYELTVES